MRTDEPTRQQLEAARSVVRWHVYRDARKFPAHVADFDDLQQAAMEVVLRKWGRRPAATPLTAWLHLTARSAVIDAMRYFTGKSRHNVRGAALYGMRSLDEVVVESDGMEEITLLDLLDLATEDEPYEEIDEAERRSEIVHEALALLPMNLATVAELALMEEMTLAEIGELMGFSESRACQLLGDARAMLTVSLSAHLAA